MIPIDVFEKEAIPKGITLRDLFAVLAMHALLQNEGEKETPKATARNAYVMADAMMKNRRLKTKTEDMEETAESEKDGPAQST